MRVRQAGILSVLLLAGCALDKPYCDRACVSGRVEKRTGHFLDKSPPCGSATLPPDFAERPLTEEAAVLFALWNNPAFQELLVDLEVTHADLIQAGLLPNPEFVYWYPEHLKPLKYLFDMPIEAMWLLPIRVRNAKLENDRACERLTQAALDLMRDTRQSYADVLLAKRRIEVAKVNVEYRDRIAKLATARLEAGDV